MTTYDKDIVKGKMYGEYGQYRVIGFHQEGDCEQKQNTGGDVCEELLPTVWKTRYGWVKKPRIMPTATSSGFLPRMPIRGAKLCIVWTGMA